MTSRNSAKKRNPAALREIDPDLIAQHVSAVLRRLRPATPEEIAAKQRKNENPDADEQP